MYKTKLYKLIISFLSDNIFNKANKEENINANKKR